MQIRRLSNFIDKVIMIHNRNKITYKIENEYILYSISLIEI